MRFPGLMLSALPLLCVALAPNARAQAGPADSKRSLALEILELTRTADLALAVMERSIEGQRRANSTVPAVFWDRFLVRARERKTELVDSLVPVYTEAFSIEELRGLIAFYRTPLGKRLLEAQADLTQGGMTAGERWGTRLGEEVQAELEAEGVKLN